MRRLYLFVSFCAALWSTVAVASPRLPSFSSLGVSDGLSQSDVSAITQDSTGFIWLGTRNGLNRYDGYGMVTWKQDMDGSGTLGSSIITALATGLDGSVWVGTLNGLNRYDQASGKFAYYGCSYDRQGHRYEFNEVSGIFVSPAFGTWVISGDFLSQYDGSGDSFTAYRLPLQYRSKLCSVLPCGSDSFWVGSENGLYLFSVSGKTFTQVLSGTPFDSKENLRVYSIVNDHASLLLGTNQGILRYSPGDGSLEQVRYRGKDLGRIERLYRSRDGRIWAGTRNGLYMFDGESSSCFMHDPSDPSSISSDKILSLYQDRTGVLWAGTLQGGVSRMDLNRKQYYVIHPRIDQGEDPIVSAVMAEGDSVIWMGVGDGRIDRVDLKTGDTESSYVDFPARTYAYDLGQIMDIDPAGDDGLWLSTGKGLYRFDKFSRRSVPVDIMLPKGRPSYAYPNLINSMETDIYGNLWCCSPSGIFILDPAGNLLQHIERSGTPESIPKNNIQAIYRDSSGTMWVASRNGGLSRFTGTVDEPSFITYVNSERPGTLSHNNVCSIFEDSGGRFWIGTWGGGVNLMDRDSGTFRRYTVGDGLLDDVVFAISEDPSGIVWFSTYQGLSAYDPGTGSFTAYPFSDVSRNEEAVFAEMETGDDGTLFVCRLDGLVCFDTRYKALPRTIAPVAVTSFTIYGRPDTAAQGCVPHKVELSWKDKHFSIGFSSFDFASAGGTYSYKIEGIDKDWILTDRHTANYSNLSPGHYRFLVRYSDMYGNGSSSASGLQIRVRPPLWATAGAFALYAVLGIAAAAFAIRQAGRRNRQRQLRMEEKLRLAGKEELYNAKMAFFTNMSHELRTPLTLILGPIPRIKSALAENVELLKAVEIMENNSGRLLRMVNQLLDFRKIDTGNMTVRYSQVDLCGLVRRTAGYFSDAAYRKNISVSENIPCKITVSTDADKVEKILYNLMSNAVKFASSRIGVAVSVSPSGDGVRVFVSDDGPGIPADEVGNIFKRFYQVGSQTGGSGLGLNLSSGLARVIGGDLSVDSSEGHGSTFCLLIPAKDMVIVPEEAAENRSADSGAASSGSPLVLVADDNSDMRFFISSALSGSYRVMEAADGKEALQLLNRSLPDLVISDIMMPGMSGQELTRAIKEDRKMYNVPVIIVSARTSDEDRVSCLEAGADAYIPKPFSGQYLKLQVDNMILHQKKIREQLSIELMTSPGSIEVKSPADKALQLIVRLIEENISDPEFNVEKLSAQAGISRMQIYRLLKNMVGQVPSEFIKNFRLSRAASLIEKGGLNINEISYMVGFGDSKYFSACFKRKYGISPKEYGRKGKSKPDTGLGESVSRSS